MRGCREVLSCCLLLAMTATLASAALPVYEREPFDEVTLDDVNDRAVLLVKPLTLAERKPLTPEGQKGDLEVELLDRPGEKFALSWQAVVRVRLFEQLVLAEIDANLTAGKFEEAQAGLRFLERTQPKFPGLSEAVERFLLDQTTAAYRGKRLDEALALAVELARRNPQQPRLATIYERVTLDLAQQSLNQQAYRRARGLLGNLKKRFPQTGPAAAAPLEAKLQELASAALAEANAAATAQNWESAQAAVRKALDLQPAIAGGAELAARIFAKHPVLEVGVIGGLPAKLSAEAFDADLLDAGIRRLRPLVSPPAAELASLPDGGLGYRSAWGAWQTVSGREATLQLTGSTAAEFVQQLRLAGPLAAPVSAIRARTANSVTWEWESPRLRPEAWLGITLSTLPTQPTGDDVGAPLAPQPVGPFRAQLTPSGELRLARTAPAAVEAPQAVVEKSYRDAASALAALRRGEIQVLERLPPWEVARARKMPDLRLSAYAAPTVHLLLPNPKRPLSARREFRRALLYALDREAILTEGILSGQPSSGCELLSGLFPRSGDGEPWSAAFHPDLRPRGYDPAVAAVLLELARSDPANPAGTGGGGTSPPLALTLDHPDEPVARAACLSIQRQWRRIGVEATLRPRKPGEPSDGDVRYVQLVVTEPLVDAYRLFGSGGAVGDVGPLVQEKLEQALAESDAAGANSRLRELQALVAQELPILPLWQTVDHFVQHASVTLPAGKPLRLYEQLDQWRLAWRPPLE